jgi:uncharacterized protein (DUF433 family)
MKEYVIQRDGGYYISNSRISLDSVVYAFHRGASPESIRRSFPLLTLEEIYGAITFYLSHQQEIDSYLKDAEAEFEKMREKSREANPELHKKLDETRKNLQTQRS